MPDPKDRYFEVATGRELREKYGLHAENYQPRPIDSEVVPDALQPLIPYAERWGITDDLIRGDCVDKCSSDEMADVLKSYAPHRDAVDDWLLEVQENDEIDDTWHAFFCLRTAVDALQLKQRPPQRKSSVDKSRFGELVRKRAKKSDE